MIRETGGWASDPIGQGVLLTYYLRSLCCKNSNPKISWSSCANQRHNLLTIKQCKYFNICLLVNKLLWGQGSQMFHFYSWILIHSQTYLILILEKYHALSTRYKRRDIFSWIEATKGASVKCNLPARLNIICYVLYFKADNEDTMVILLRPYTL